MIQRLSSPWKQLIALAASAGILFCAGCAGRTPAKTNDALPDGFVYATDAAPGIVLDIRYYSEHNFVGRRIDGYLTAKAILTCEAASALAKAEEELRPFGLGLKVFDAYRPARAVAHFVRWAGDPADVKGKAEFYPDISKDRLLPEGYIAAKSSHSRGSTVDLTIVSLLSKDRAVSARLKDAMKIAAGLPATEGEAFEELDMGTSFDFFGKRSWATNQDLSAGQRANRALLRSVMTRHGFVPYAEEWWHFTLKDEPYPDREFDFPMR